MNRIFTGKAISLALLLVLLTGCTQATETPSPTLTSTIESTSTETPPATGSPVVTESPMASESPFPGAESGTPASGSDQCVNPYYPVRQGATWTYASTRGPTGGYGFTHTITSVREDGFTLTSQFGDLTRTQEWSCTPEGLVALQLGGASAAIINNDNMTLSLDVDHVSGVTFPSLIAPGDTWQHELTFTGTITVAGQKMEAQGNAQSSFRADNYESVTVPAGMFDAIKIHIDSTINITGNFNGVNFPVTVTSPYDYWFVEGVGWVKASGTGSISGQSFTETIELQSYNIP